MMRKILFFHFTHDLFYEILYAFKSVIKLICQFFYLLQHEDKKKHKKFHKRRSVKIHHLDESSESLPHYLSELKRSR